MGLCGHRTSSTSKLFDKKPLVVVYYAMDYVKNPKGTNYWRNRVMKVGKKARDAGKEVYFAVSSASELSWELNEYGIESPDDKKVYVTARDTSNQKFKMEAEFR